VGEARLQAVMNRSFRRTHSVAKTQGRRLLKVALRFPNFARPARSGFFAYAHKRSSACAASVHRDDIAASCYLGQKAALASIRCETPNHHGSWPAYNVWSGTTA